MNKLARVRRWARLFSAGVVALGLSACGGGAGGVSFFGSNDGGNTGGIPGALTVTSSQASIPADGLSTVAVIATLADTNGTPIAGRTINFTTSAGTLSATSAGTDSQGQAVVFLKSAISKGQAVVQATESASGLTGNTPIQFAAGAATRITLAAAPTTVGAGRPTSVTVQVFDANNNTVPGKTVRLNSTAGTGTYATSSTATTDLAGIIDTTFTPTASTILSATLVDENRTSSPVSVTVDANASPVGNLALIAVVGTANADGSSTAVVRATVTDTNGQVIAGIPVSFTATGTSGAPSPSSGNVTTQANGAADFSMTSTRAGSVTVRASSGGLSRTTTVTFASGLATTITLTATPTTVAPNRPTAVSVRVLDSNGNPVAGRAIRLNSNPGTGAFTLGSNANTDAGGFVVTQFTPTASTQISATLIDGNITSSPVAITVDANAAVVGDLVLTTVVPSANADGTSMAVVRAAVTDVDGNPVPGYPVSFSTLGGTPTPASGTVNTLANGFADFSLASTTPATITVRAASGGASRSTTVTFVGSAAVSTVSLLASSPQLQSGATAVGQGVTITALLKDSGNNVVRGAQVSFTSARVSTAACGRGGALTPIVTQTGVPAGTTDDSGSAAAVLTTGGDPQNQTIGVTARSGTTSNTINIAVTGTVLQLSGPASLGLGTRGTYTLSLKNSSGTGIANQSITISGVAAVGNSFSLPQDGASKVSVLPLTTDASGQSSFYYYSDNGGTDRISAATENSCNTAAQDVAVSTQALAFVVGGTSAAQVLTTATFTIAPVGATTASDQVVNVGSAANASLFSSGDLVRIRDGVSEIVGTVRSVSGTTLTVRTTIIVSGAAGGTMAAGATATEQNDEVVIGAQDSTTDTNVIAQTFKVKLTGGTVAGQPISFTTSRGSLTPNSGIVSNGTVNTDANGVAAIRVSQTAAGLGTGGGVITATGPGGITATTSFSVVSHDPQTIALQATPNNVPTTRDSLVRATVRDTASNPVKDSVVNFTLSDTSGGRLSASSAVTDGQGIATVTYTASTNTSARDGVVITGRLASGSGATANVALTVGGQALRIVLGTGNTISEASSTLYSYPYSVLVTDSAGNPPPSGTTVSLLAEPVAYQKGVKVCDPSPPWRPTYTIGATAPATITTFGTGCANEDVNLNGIRDPGEDTNGSGALDPGNVVSVPNSVQLDSSGTAAFSLTYPQDRSDWVRVRLTAVVNVAGTESRETQTFVLPGSASDYSDCNVNPPGVFSPYGQSYICGDTN